VTAIEKDSARVGTHFADAFTLEGYTTALSRPASPLYFAGTEVHSARVGHQPAAGRVRDSAVSPSSRKVRDQSHWRTRSFLAGNCIVLRAWLALQSQIEVEKHSAISALASLSAQSLSGQP
jgi:hypothetical protein